MLAGADVFVGRLHAQARGCTGTGTGLISWQSQATERNPIAGAFGHVKEVNVESRLCHGWVSDGKGVKAPESQDTSRLGIAHLPTTVPLAPTEDLKRWGWKKEIGIIEPFKIC